MKITRTFQFKVRVTISAEGESQFWARLELVKHYLQHFLSDHSALAGWATSVDVVTDANLKETIEV